MYLVAKLQNFIKLSAAIHKLSCSQTKNKSKTILSSLPWTVTTCKQILPVQCRKNMHSLLDAKGHQ